MKRVITYIILLSILLFAGCADPGEETEQASLPTVPSTVQTEASTAPEPTEPQPSTQPTTQPTEPPVTEPETQPTEPPVDQVLRNTYDGYQLTVQAGYTIDSSMAQVVTVLSKEDTVIELYRQPVSSITPYSYLSYSNKFFDNTVDHIQDLNELRTYNGREFRVIAWHREKAKRLEDDKNYYLSFETTHGDQHYSIFVKSSVETSDPDEFLWMLDSLEFFPPEGNAPVWTSSTPERNWNEETTQFYERCFAVDADLTWGIFEPDAANGELGNLLSYEAALNYDFPILLTYLGFYEASYTRLQQLLDASWEEEKVMMLTFQPTGTADGGNMMYDILQGEYDSVIHHYADIIHDFSHPVLVRLMNEMNGDWCEYSAYHTSKDTLIYKAVYRYIWEIFQRMGVDNAIWVWNPNEGSFPDFTWNHMLNYYPGDQYVDVVGLTAYNTGSYYQSVGERWQDFPTLYDSLYAQYCDLFSQPLMITEFSCAAVGGDKIAWTQEMLDTIEDYGRIKVAIWWDHVDYDPSTGQIARDYRIDDVLDVFKAYFAS